MREGGGHDKGSGFERDECRRLSLWVTSGLRDDVFWRSAASGGRAKIASKAGKVIEYTSSDIAAAPGQVAGLPLLELFTVECKHVADLHLQDLPFNRESNIAVFWRQVVEDAKITHKWPMLIARQNRKPQLVGITPECFDLIECVLLNEDKKLPVALHSERYNLTLMDYAEFFAVFLPAHLGELKNDNRATSASSIVGSRLASHSQSTRRVSLVAD